MKNKISIRIILGLSFILFAGTLVYYNAFAEEKKPEEKKPEYIAKIPVLFPEGSTLMRFAHEIENRIEKESKGRVKIIWYTGGVAGDEPDVVRKMRLGQYHGSIMSGLGLQKILPAVEVLELPVMFNNYEEVDYIYEKMTPDIKKLFREAGYEFLGFADQGFLYLWTTKPVKTFNDLQALKIELWSGLFIAQALIESFKLQGVPITLPEILSGLQTGLIEAIYAGHLLLIALQWHTQVKYMINIPLTHGIGGFVVDKKYYDKLPKDIQTLLSDTVKSYLPHVNQQVRKDDEVAFQGIKEYGIEIIKPSPEIVKEFETKANILWYDLADKLYPKSLLDKMLVDLKEYREKNK